MTDAAKLLEQADMTEYQDANAFLQFLTSAFQNVHGEDMKKLYNYLFTTFAAADIQMVGAVSRNEFDALIEASARTVRRLGLAPQTQLIYRNGVEEKYARRTQLFKEMDAANSNQVTWEEYLNYTRLHIKKKLEKQGLL